MPSLFEFSGGEAAIHRLEEIFYASVLADPLLQPLFGKGKAEHVEHLTAFTSESFGGPDRFSRELGFAHLIAVHRGHGIKEEQRARFVELYMAALDEARMPTDPDFRQAVREHVEVRVLRCHAELERNHGRRASSAARGAKMDMGRGDAMIALRLREKATASWVVFLSGEVRPRSRRR